MQYLSSRNAAFSGFELLGLLWLIGLGTTSACGQTDFEQAPINYSQSTPRDAVASLQSKLDDGEIDLEFDRDHGYLKAILKELNIKPSSQVLVHSQTSFQLRKISPRRPRALYFNDHSYVGWVQGGDVIEIMTTDSTIYLSDTIFSKFLSITNR